MSSLGHFILSLEKTGKGYVPQSQERLSLSGRIMGTSTFRLHIFLRFLQWVCMVFITLKKSLLFGKNSGLAKGRKNRGYEQRLTEIPELKEAFEEAGRRERQGGPGQEETVGGVGRQHCARKLGHLGSNLSRARTAYPS